MAGNKSFFSILKSLFIPDASSRVNKDKRRRRWVVRLLKMKRSPTLPAPSPPRESSLPESRGHAISVIVVTDTPDEFPYKIQSDCQDKNNTKFEYHNLAATIIQAAFRRYLAKKALRALKGVVMLQAIIRGCAVRRQAMNTLKCLQSIVNIQSQVYSKRCEKGMHQEEYTRIFGENDIKVDLNSQKRWDDSTLTKEEIRAHFVSKRDASIKRERIKEYYLNHRKSAETERDKAYGRRRYWLEQWVDSQLAKRENLGNSDLAKTLDSASCVPRRSSSHRKQRSIGDDNSFAGSPLVPTYMASTTSATAKARSLSSPRLRPVSFDVCSDITSPYKHKVSPISSINSELTIGSNWIGSSFKSAGLRGSPSSVKSTMSTKDFRLRGIYYQSGIQLPTTADDSNLVLD